LTGLLAAGRWPRPRGVWWHHAQAGRAR